MNYFSQFSQNSRRKSDELQQSRQTNIIMRLIDILNSPDFALLDMDILLGIVSNQENSDTIQERCEQLAEKLQHVADNLL